MEQNDKNNDVEMPLLNETQSTINNNNLDVSHTKEEEHGEGVVVDINLDIVEEWKDSKITNFDMIDPEATVYLPYYAYYQGEIMGKYGGSHPLGDLCEEPIKVIEKDNNIKA